MPENIVFFLLLCYIADMLLGDPPRWPHPVRLIGKLLNYAENIARQSGISLKICGFTVLGIGSLLVFWIISFLVSLPLIGLIAALYFGYSSLALGCLVRETRKVQSLVASGNLIQAREALSMLVSRDTSSMNEQDLYRSLAETASENYNDAFCAPFFYLCLLGLPWVWVYKLISTIDSMWGYKNDRWKDLGYAGAKFDDFLAFLPARLGAASMFGAAWIMGLRPLASIKTVSEQAGAMDSPNAGWTMAAGANILGVTMGGNFVYFGKKKSKPILGQDLEKYSSAKIDQLISLIVISSIVYSLPLLGLVFLM